MAEQPGLWSGVADGCGTVGELILVEPGVAGVALDQGAGEHVAGIGKSGRGLGLAVGVAELQVAGEFASRRADRPTVWRWARGAP